MSADFLESGLAAASASRASRRALASACRLAFSFASCSFLWISSRALRSARSCCTACDCCSEDVEFGGGALLVEVDVCVEDEGAESAGAKGTELDACAEDIPTDEYGPRDSNTTPRRLKNSSLVTPDAKYSLSSPFLL